VADEDSPKRAAGAAAKPRTGAAAKPRTGTAAKPRTGTGTAAEPGADAAAEPRADAAGEPGTGGGARGRAGLKIHHLRPAPGAHTARTRVGRGEAGKGKTAGRGTKGTKARGQVAPGFEGGQMPLQRRVPKLRGFSNLRFKTTYQVVNTGRLAELYPQGGDVTPEDLVAKGAVRAGNLVKVLGTGDADVTLRVTAHAFSAAAREKITAAGGTVTEL
jgi:large subunit ribosomal protein L15